MGTAPSFPSGDGLMVFDPVHDPDQGFGFPQVERDPAGDVLSMVDDALDDVPVDRGKGHDGEDAGMDYAYLADPGLPESFRKSFQKAVAGFDSGGGVLSERQEPLPGYLVKFCRCLDVGTVAVQSQPFPEPP